MPTLPENTRHVEPVRTEDLCCHGYHINLFYLLFASYYIYFILHLANLIIDQFGVHSSLESWSKFCFGATTIYCRFWFEWAKINILCYTVERSKVSHMYSGVEHVPTPAAWERMAHRSSPSRYSLQSCFIVSVSVNLAIQFNLQFSLGPDPIITADLRFEGLKRSSICQKDTWARMAHQVPDQSKYWLHCFILFFWFVSSYLIIDRFDVQFSLQS
jgi:hypothetical protein